jgi:hypothetical protein
MANAREHLTFESELLSCLLGPEQHLIAEARIVGVAGDEIQASKAECLGQGEDGNEPVPSPDPGDEFQVAEMDSATWDNNAAIDEDGNHQDLDVVEENAQKPPTWRANCHCFVHRLLICVARLCS